MDSANTSPAQTSHKLDALFRTLEDVVELTRAIKQQFVRYPPGNSRISWYVAATTVRSFTVVEIETMPILHNGNLIWEVWINQTWPELTSCLVSESHASCFI